MGANLRPFRVAFWALLFALGLSVVVHLTDPRSVRLAILAKHETPPQRHAVAPSDSQLAHGDSLPIGGVPTPTPVTDDAHALQSHPQWVAESESPSLEEGPLFAAAIDTRLDNENTTPPDAPVTANAAPDRRSPAAARHVSSPFGRSTERADIASRDQNGTMPVLAPTRLQRNSGRGEYVELPPPPEWEQPPAPQALALGPTMPETQSLISSPHAFPDEINDRVRQDRFLQQRLDAEIFSLRREIERLAQTQHIGQQLDQLQRQQQQILRMHQQLPIDRLMQLLDLLLVQLQTVRETIPPSHETRSMLSGEGISLEGASPRSQQERVSMRITEARLDDLLRTLSTLSGTSIVKAPQADTRTGVNSAASEPPTPKSVEQPDRTNGGSRPLKGFDTASPDSPDQKATLTERLDVRDQKAAAEQKPKADWQAPLLIPGPQSPPSSNGRPRPASARTNAKWTASASSCTACHRAKGIR